MIIVIIIIIIIIKPFVTPDDVDLKHRDNERSTKDPSDDNSINNLVPLLIHPTRDNNEKVLPPVLEDRVAVFSILTGESKTRLKP